MYTAKKYNLTFYISEMPGFTKRPGIGVSNVNGNALNHEIASFLETNGLELTEHIRGEINSLDYTFDFEGYAIWGYHDSESVEISNHPPDPPVAIFNTGGTDISCLLPTFWLFWKSGKYFLNQFRNHIGSTEDNLIKYLNSYNRAYLFYKTLFKILFALPLIKFCA